ncbi:EamA family transporter [Paenibacillus amylolyticus]|nr:EamA family transporter [Paenibacillus amylolyticus]
MGIILPVYEIGPGVHARIESGRISFWNCLYCGRTSFHRRLFNMDRRTLVAGAIMGTALFAAFVFITYGVQRTTTSQAGFLISLVVIFVPILTTIQHRRMPDKRLTLSILVAVTGLGLLTLQHQLSLHTGIFSAY